MTDSITREFTLVVPSSTGPSQKVYLNQDGTFDSERGTERMNHSSGSLYIGSAEGNHIRRADATLSRYHAELCFDDQARTWTIKDLGSSNGTLLVYIDAQKREYREPVPTNRFVRLKHYENGRIEAGGLTIRVRHKSDSNAAEQTSSPEAAPEVQPTLEVRESAPCLVVRHPSGWQRNIALAGTSLSIGANLNNDLVLDDALVAPHHALLVYEGRAGAQAAEGPGWYVLDLGSTSGTFIDGWPLTNGKRVLLKLGQVMTIGRMQIDYRQTREGWRLQVYAPGYQMRAIDLDNSPFTIGSATDNDYTLEPDVGRSDSEIAPYHAQLLETMDGWAIRDLGGPGGTQVHTQTLRPFARQLLRENNEFTIGNTTFVMAKRAWQSPAARQELTIHLDTTVLRCPIGETITTTVEISSNVAVTIDLYTELKPADGSAPAARTQNWISLTVQRLALEPGERSFTELDVQLPAEAALVGHSYTLEVTCHKNGAAVASTQATLDILPRFEIALQPDEVKLASGSITTAILNLTNNAAIPAMVDLLVNSPEGKILDWLRLTNSSIELDARQSRQVTLTVLPELSDVTPTERIGFEIIGRSTVLGEARAAGQLMLGAPLRLRLDPGDLTVAIGQTVHAHIEIAADIDDTIKLRIESVLPSEWISLSLDEVVVKAGQVSRQRMTIQTRWRKDVPIGLNSLRIVGTSKQLGQLVCEATVTVLELIQISSESHALELTPGQQSNLQITITSQIDTDIKLKIDALPDKWTVEVPGQMLDLQASGSQNVQLKVQPPIEALPGEYELRLLCVAGDDLVLADASITLELTAMANDSALLLTLDQTNLTCTPGRPRTVFATVTNSGTLGEIVQLVVSAVPDLWTFPPLPVVELAAGASRELPITLEPGVNLPSGAYSLTIRADSSRFGSSACELQVVVPPRVSVQLLNSVLRTMPGQPVTTELEVRSDVADNLRFTVVGPVKHWATFEPQVARLVPSRSEVIRMTIAPPVEHAEALGVYNFQVLARGQVTSQQIAEAELTVVAPPHIQMDTQSLAVAIGQTITCAITITSNVDADDIVVLSIEPDDPVGGWATLSDTRLRLAPRATRQVQLSIAVPRRAVNSAGTYTLRLIAAARHGGRVVTSAGLRVLKPEDLRLASNRLSVAAGQSIATSVYITNTGTERDRAVLTLEGTPHNWANFTPSTVQVEPGETTTATLTIQVPREATGHDAICDFAVAVTWEDAPVRPYCSATLVIEDANVNAEVEQLRRTTAISLLLSEEALAVEAGQATGATIIVRNLWKIVDRVSFSVRGIPAEWVSFTPPSVALLPGDAGEVAMLIQPPRDWRSSAGVHNFTVLGMTEHNPHDEAVARVSLQIAPFSELTTDIQPRQQTHWRRAQYRLLIMNRGNLGLAHDITSHDEEQQVLISPKVTHPVLAPGGERTIPVEARAQRLLWFGVPKLHSLTLRVSPITSASGGETVAAALVQEQTARLIQQPVFSPGILLILLLLLLALLAPWVVSYWNRMLAPAPIAMLQPTVPPLPSVTPAPDRVVFLVQTPTDTIEPAPTTLPVATVVVIEQVTSQVVVTAPPQVTVLIATSVPQPTARPAPTSPPPTATAVPQSVCGQNGSFMLRGYGTPHTGVLLYFNGRAINGTAVGPDGIWSIPLRLGDEPVRSLVVIDRATLEVLSQTICR